MPDFAPFFIKYLKKNPIWYFFLAHLGHYHQKFSENYDTIKQLIIGLPSYREIFQHNNNLTPLVANRSVTTPVQAQRPPSKFSLLYFIHLVLLFFSWNHFLKFLIFSSNNINSPSKVCEFEISRYICLPNCWCCH